jgi:hypothetical protein
MSPRRLVGLVAAVALAFAPAACRKEPGPPSEAYAQAHKRFTKLYGQKLDAAYVDPAMAEIEAQLGQVPPDSVDAPAAQELLTRIRDGRRQQEQVAQETQEAIERARTPLDMPTSRTPDAPTPPPPPREPPDAGQPDAGQGAAPDIGTPAAQLVAGFNGCFRRAQAINIEGRGMRDAWEMVDRLACRLEYPGVADKVLVIEEDKVLALLAKSSLKVTSEPPSAPDAGR